MRNIVVLTLILFLACYKTSLSQNQKPTKESIYADIRNNALENFWGNAKLRNGRRVKAKNELEKKILPISRIDANKVIESAHLSAAAAWCRVRWQNNLFNLTANARKQKLNDKQIAFIGFLHEIAMKQVEKALKSINKKCDYKMRHATQKKINKAITKIDFSSSKNM